MDIPATLLKRPGRLLIVEDSATQAELLEGLLLQHGYQVQVARNGREGLEKTRELLPELVLSDIMMPEMTGFELCNAIKSDKRLKRIPVILLTSLDDPKDLIRGLECRADNFITKPYREQDLLLRIETILAGGEPSAGGEQGVITYAGRQYRIDADRQQIITLLLSTYETAVQKNNELLSIQSQLGDLNEQLEERVAQRTESLQQEVQERKRAEETLSEVTRRLQLATASAHLGIWDWDIDRDGMIWDDKMYELYGIPPGTQLSGIESWEQRLHPDDLPMVQAALEAALHGEGEYAIEHRVLPIGGPLRHIKANGIVIRDETGRAVRMTGLNQDISAQKNLEEQLRQAQKMEAIGQFAGGIAHDFNNILTAILGFSSLLQMKIPEHDPLRFNVDQVVVAAERAAGLTQSLLAFSRKQVLNLRPVSLNEVIKKVDKFVGRIIGEDIKLQFIFKEEDIVVNADSGQIEQVLLNLATNARDAMPQGGVFSIVTETVQIDQEYIDFYGFGALGYFARIAVSDSGIGMDAEIRKRIFDPFFTTKEVGKGTGLGLSIVYGIVQQHKGFINVYSEPGRGTTFSIYLPLGKAEQAVRAEQAETQIPVGGTETILLAEDDALVRDLSRTVLTDFGYTVLEATNGEEAVRVFLEHRDQVRLLLFDIVMPKKNGKEAYEEIRRAAGNVKVIFLSGYPAEVIGSTGLLEQGANLIMKPVHPQNLLRRIREELDRPAPAGQQAGE
ncbi:MAG TPA: hybrid sensor histidine kinase/response regulator [Geobacter sp.]|nr:hybrid sensor histidine kinase/response regulator [Geobacter sp.]